MEIVLITLTDNQLYAKFSNCSFGLLQIEYLGHLVSAEGVHMDKLKVESILQWVEPKNIKQLRGFLGLSGYYRRFIQNYGTIASPFTNLYKKYCFLWTKIAQEAFMKLKHAIATTPVLRLPDFSVLSQNNHPIAYFFQEIGNSHAETISICERALCSHRSSGQILALFNWPQVYYQN